MSRRRRISMRFFYEALDHFDKPRWDWRRDLERIAKDQDVQPGLLAQWTARARRILGRTDD